jgi:cell division inhibitor SepF
MPGAMHRMGVYLGLVEDEEYADTASASDGYGPPADRAPARREDYAEPRYARGRQVENGRDAGRGYDDPYLNGASSNGYSEFAPPSAPTYQITSLHPRTYNEARTIGEHFRQSTPVIMNLTEMDDADAKRLVDFAAGLTFGLHGRLERVTAKVFLLSPHNVTVTAQDKAKIENGFFNQS